MSTYNLFDRAPNIRRVWHSGGGALEKRADRMVSRSNRVLKPVTVGDIVLVPILMLTGGDIVLVPILMLTGDPGKVNCCVLEEREENNTMGTM